MRNNEEEEEDSKKSSIPVCACQSKIQVRTQDDGSQYKSFDPAGAIPDATQEMIPELSKTLCDESKTLLERYRCMFTLRNLGGEKAVMALCKALEKDKSSAIMRHEIAFVLGQMASMCDNSYKSIPSLSRMLARTKEHGMVRHEAALAIGCLGTWNKKSYKIALQVLKKYALDKDRLVAESCECALDDLTAPIDWVGKDGW